jgi:hypothetical protein
MKYLFVLALFLLVVALAYRSARPYIIAARRFLNLFRDAQRLSPDDTANAPQRRSSTRAPEKLARCATCGTWLPASRALVLRTSPDLYCSPDCIAAKADARETRRKSAS